MKSMPWFRMYTDFLNDPKMVAMAFEDQRHFIGILALKAEGVIDQDCDAKIRDRIVAQRLWIDFAVIGDVKSRLVLSGLIDDVWQPVAWEKRQVKSDRDETGAERQRRFRDKKQSNGMRNDDSNALCNGTVTPPEESRQEESKPTSTDVDVVAGKPTTPCPQMEIVSLYGELLPTMPYPKIWDGARAKNLQSRWKWVLDDLRSRGKPSDKAAGLDYFRRYFGYVSKSDFLTGRSGKWDSCDLGWLVKAENFSKVISGNYENKEAA